MPGEPLLSGSHLSAVVAAEGKTQTLMRLQNAMTCLAQFHCAAAVDGLTSTDQSPGLQHRLRFANELCNDQLAELQLRLEGLARWPFHDRLLTIFRLAAPRVAGLPSLLTELANQRLPLQPCIRDIWSDHVLFVGESVTGIVDFGAMQTECVAADIARLLGSVVPHFVAVHGGEPKTFASVWSAGIDAYRQIRPLTDLEGRAISCFHQSTTVLAGFNWIRWLVVEGKQFGNGVEQRLDAIIDGLRSTL